MKIENIEISHPDKILFPEADISKADMANYYARIASYLLPTVSKRPLTLRRYPEGIHGEGFYNKHAPDYFPVFIERFSIPMHHKTGKIQMVSANKTEDLVYFAGQNTIEIHMGLSKIDTINKPDQIIFDFDPSDDDFDKVRHAALALKEMLDKFGLRSFVKTTGSRGVHMHLPIEVHHTFSSVKEIAKKLAEKLHEKCPELTTMEHRKNKRGNKVFIDYLRNDYGMTAIAPYSLRAHKDASIATPIDWDELADKSLGPRSFTLENIFRRLAQKRDPWQDFEKNNQTIQSIRL